jgi:hypothetical protein
MRIGIKPRRFNILIHFLANAYKETPTMETKITPTENRPETTEESSLPFFARFLEGQEASTPSEAAAERMMTLKYPSDRDEWPD